jgi:hypothetical protein
MQGIFGDWADCDMKYFKLDYNMDGVLGTGPHGNSVGAGHVG